MVSDSNTPPAQKRRDRNRERVRVTRACDRCRKRKIKCDGTQPCGFCIQAKASCTFFSSYARGRKPSIVPSTRVDEDTVNTSRSSVPGQQLTPLLPRTHTEFQDQHVSCSPSVYTGNSTPNSPEPSQTDFQGHYIGPASGLFFLLRIQKRLHHAISFSQTSSIFTFGDAPLYLPETDPSFCMMLPRADAQRLLDRYFDFSMPTYRFLHKPTIQEWFDEFYDTLGVMRDMHNAPARVSLLFMVFAQARVYMPDNDRPGPPDLSTRYFLAAEHQLTKEKGSIRLTSVQARLLQCYYLLTQSRINHCWSLFGTVSHLALAIGLNRNISPNPGTGISLIESECRRRTFWCSYTLDAYLSAALGRPRTFHDDDIDTELPACVEDEELMVSHDTTVLPMSSSRGPSTMLAAVAHMKLAQIISKILTKLYSIKPTSATRRAAAVKEISKDLSDWRAELSRFLDIDSFNTWFLVPLFRRQRNVLNLTYWHAVILTRRPVVLSNFARLSQRKRGGGRGQDSTNDESLGECLDAAMKTVDTINEITEKRQLFRAFWITAYFAFNATIMLYIYVIQESSSPREVYKATRCQSHISAIAEKGSLLERYFLVLDELRVEALRQTSSMQQPQPQHQSTTGPTVMTPHSQTQSQSQSQSQLQETGLQTMSMPMYESSAPDSVGYTGLAQDPGIELNGSNISGFSFCDSSGWDQFTCMVSSGLGNMDMFLGGDAFRASCSGVQPAIGH